MDYHINVDELKLLAHPGSTVRGYGPNYSLDPSDVLGPVELDKAAFHRVASYLAELDLVGLEAERIVTFGSDELIVRGIWLTGLGANFLRGLEAAPGVAKRVTVAVIAQAAKLGSDIFVKVATQMTTELAKQRGLIIP